jgi:hypothetical protein
MFDARESDGTINTKRPSRCVAPYIEPYSGSPGALTASRNRPGVIPPADTKARWKLARSE